MMINYYVIKTFEELYLMADCRPSRLKKIKNYFVPRSEKNIIFVVVSRQ